MSRRRSLPTPAVVLVASPASSLSTIEVASASVATPAAVTVSQDSTVSGSVAKSAATDVAYQEFSNGFTVARPRTPAVTTAHRSEFTSQLADANLIDLALAGPAAVRGQ